MESGIFLGEGVDRAKQFDRVEENGVWTQRGGPDEPPGLANARPMTGSATSGFDRPACRCAGYGLLVVHRTLKVSFLVL
jgi:hypothetical protein